MRRRREPGVTSVILAGVLTACTVGGDLGSRDGGATASDAGAPDVVVDPCLADRDGDGIADRVEPDGDTDSDGTPDVEDPDGDGDGIPDLEERGGEARGCASVDCDEDGIANWLELDSDNDGLLDADERRQGTDPCDIDTDGDRVTDFVEVEGSMTDPISPSSTISPNDFYVVLPFRGDTVERTLRFGSNIAVADIYFLIDTSGSMMPTIENLRASLRDELVPEIRRRIPNIQMGVGTFEDLPFLVSDRKQPQFSEGYGLSSDRPYEHITDVTDDVTLVQGALDSLGLGNGWDWPESQLEALYQTVTGAGGRWEYLQMVSDTRYSISTYEHDVRPRLCPSVPDETGRRRGYPCFRPNALPIVVLASDANWHEGYPDVMPAGRTMEEVGAAFDAIGARFISISIDNGRGLPRSRTQSSELAVLTGSVDRDGQPLVFDSAYGEVSMAVLRGVETLVTAVPQDVTTRTSNYPPNPDDVDATRFIQSITPLEGYYEGVRGRGYDSYDAASFYGVIPGTVLEFQVDFRNDFQEHQLRPQIFRAKITVVGHGSGDLDTRVVYILVPGTDGTPILI